MKKALIMSDDLILSYALAEELSAAGWGADTTSTLSVFDVDASRPEKYDCMILVVTRHFKETILKQEKSIEQCLFDYSRKLPLYIVFEHAYDKAVDRHLRFAKRVFDKTDNSGRIKEIVDAIVNPDPAVVDYTGFVSPMSSI